MIDVTATYGEQIALACRNHPEKRWSTKNIAPIGCRTIFYNLFNEPDMGLECDCPLSDLMPVAAIDAYNEGCCAGFEAYPGKECPFTPGTKEFEGWLEGWSQAKERANV